MHTPEKIPIKQGHVICQLFWTEHFHIKVHAFCWIFLFWDQCLQQWNNYNEIVGIENSIYYLKSLRVKGFQ